MAYDTDDLREQALSAIIENNLYFNSDVIAMLPCSNRAYYDHNLHECNDIKKALESNRINAKMEMRKKWLKSDNATMQMGLMKLLSEDDELRKLAMEYKQHSGEVGIKKITRVIVDPKDE